MTVKTESLRTVPSHLIYEMDEGKPIYYKGYKELLNGNKNNGDTMPDSKLQAWLKGQLFIFLSFLFQNKGFVLTVGEQGLSLKKKTWRSADIAIFRRKNFELDEHYAKLPPDIIVEIDIKGHYDTQAKAESDFERKNAQLIAFGVQKIIWVFTESQSVLVVTNEGKKEYGWNEDVPVFDEAQFNVQRIIDQFNMEEFGG